MFQIGSRPFTLKCQSVKTAALALAIAAVLSMTNAGFGATNDSTDSLDTGFHQMYSLNFAAAHRTFQNWEALHPEDPLGAAANAAAYLFGEFDRLHILEFDLFTENRPAEAANKLS